MALPIERFNASLEGELSFKGKRYGVPYALPGDHVQFRLKRAGRRTRFEVQHIERADSYDLPQDSFAEPFCEHFGSCGGCRGQHLSYAFQLKLKAGPVQHRMDEEFGLSVHVTPAPSLQHYRHRMDFVVNGDTIGLRPLGDFTRYVDLLSCGIQHERANTALHFCRQLITGDKNIGFDRETLTGTLRYITIRYGYGSGVIVLTKESASKENESYASFSERLTAACASGELQDFSLIECENSHPNEVSCTPDGVVIQGRSDYREMLGGIEFSVPYDGFFQPNPPAFDLVVEHAITLIEARVREEQGPLVDLYCGAGTIAAILTNRFPSRFTGVVGHDFGGASIERAEENLKHFAGPVDFQVTDLNQPHLDLRRVGTPSLVVVDPPRAGLSPAVRKGLKQSDAPFVLYISCNPSSQINDLVSLRDCYRPIDAAVVDCFPHTPHLEQVVLLERSGS